VLNAAARVVSDTGKFDRGMSRLMHTELHWLDVPERVQYKLGVLMYRCQHNPAPRYLTDHCTPISDTVFRQRLRSASSHLVSVPRYWPSTYGRRGFSVAGLTVWNSLPEDMRDPECSVDSYRQSLKTFFRSTSVFSALKVCYDNALYKFTFDIDILIVMVTMCDVDQGGRHVDYVTDQIITKLLDVVKRKEKKAGVAIKPFQVAPLHILFFLSLDQLV